MLCWWLPTHSSVSALRAGQLISTSLCQARQPSRGKSSNFCRAFLPLPLSSTRRTSCSEVLPTTRAAAPENVSYSQRTLANTRRSPRCPVGLLPAATSWHRNPRAFLWCVHGVFWTSALGASVRALTRDRISFDDCVRLLAYIWLSFRTSSAAPDTPSSDTNANNEPSNSAVPADACSTVRQKV